MWNQRAREQSGTPPDYAIGQRDLSGVDVNAGGAAAAGTLYWPYGIGFGRPWFFVADTGNRRVLGWHGLPWRTNPQDWFWVSRISC